MAQQDDQTLAAAELADHFIEIVLSTKPEILIGAIGSRTINEVQQSAEALAQFRLSLIQKFTNQPLANADSDD